MKRLKQIFLAGLISLLSFNASASLEIIGYKAITKDGREVNLADAQSVSDAITELKRLIDIYHPTNIIPEKVYHSIDWMLDENTPWMVSQFQEGEDIVVPEDPVKEGYTFIGWEPTVPTKMPAYDLTEIAQFKFPSDIEEIVNMIGVATNTSSGQIVYGTSTYYFSTNVPVGNRGKNQLIYNSENNINYTIKENIIFSPIDSVNLRSINLNILGHSVPSITINSNVICSIGSSLFNIPEQTLRSMNDFNIFFKDDTSKIKLFQIKDWPYDDQPDYGDLSIDEFEFFNRVKNHLAEDFCLQVTESILHKFTIAENATKIRQISCYDGFIVIFENRTKAQVKEMENYPFNAINGEILRCIDGDIIPLQEIQTSNIIRINFNDGFYATYNKNTKKLEIVSGEKSPNELINAAVWPSGELSYIATVLNSINAEVQSVDFIGTFNKIPYSLLNAIKFTNNTIIHVPENCEFYIDWVSNASQSSNATNIVLDLSPARLISTRSEYGIYDGLLRSTIYNALAFTDIILPISKTSFTESGWDIINEFNRFSYTSIKNRYGYVTNVKFIESKNTILNFLNISLDANVPLSWTFDTQTE